MKIDTATAQEATERLRKLSRSDPSPSLEERLRRINELERLILENQERIVDAINEDFGSTVEANASLTSSSGLGGRGRGYCTLGDIWAGLNTVREVKNHLHEWMDPEPVEIGFSRFPFNVPPNPLLSPVDSSHKLPTDLGR